VAPIEQLFFWIALVLYALTTGGYVYALVFRNDKILSLFTLIIITGFICHTVAIWGRHDATGHLPWSGDYETSLAGSWLIILFSLIVTRLRPDLRLMGLAVLPFVVLLMGFGVMRSPTLIPMNATLKTIWLYIHVYFALISFGAYALAMGTGVLYLLKRRAGDTVAARSNPVIMQLPSPERLDELTFRYVVFGFITDAFMIAAGAIWAKDLWGSYWSWDPVETWSLISWLIYGLAIHLRLTMGWRGGRFAWLAIAALSTVLIAYFGVTFVVQSSIHMFEVR
jgi:cytochrome c-type biogenesis protein CcsB